MRYVPLILVILVASVTPASARLGTAAAATNWQAAARTDILAAFDIYRANHPGMHDPTNPGFAAQLERARDAGLAYAARAGDRSGYQRALGAFSAELQDGHAQLTLNASANDTTSREYLWPGFVAAWRGERLLIHSSQDFLLPTGTAIEGCDGMAIADLAKTILLSQNFRWREEGDWWFRTPRIFRAGVGEERPKLCTFLAPDGSRLTLTLEWKRAPADLVERLSRATDGERTPIGLWEPRTGLFIIGLPSFEPNDEERRAYEALYEAIRTRRDALARARAVIIDLRYNGGGSSTWGQRVADALWGENAVEKRMAAYFKHVSIWWRASEGNTKYIGKVAEDFRRQGNKETAAWADALRSGMELAMARNEPFHVEADESDTPAKEGSGETGFDRPVYVITPGGCRSACLDAVDIFTQFANVKLIGAPTSGDTPYMDTRSEVLPSGKGKIVIPNKLWMGKPRKPNEIYRPDIEVRDLDWSTAVFLERIEKDLATGSPQPSPKR